jgi:hypothetical protein
MRVYRLRPTEQKYSHLAIMTSKINYFQDVASKAFLNQNMLLGIGLSKHNYFLGQERIAKETILPFQS